MNLYNMADEYKFLLEKEEYSDDDMARLLSLNSDIKQHIINIAATIRHKMDQELSILNAIARLQERIASLKSENNRVLNRINYLQDYILNAMRTSEIASITDHPDFHIKRKLNPERLDIHTEELVPSEYYKEVKELRIDNALIKHKLKEGIDVPGARLVYAERVEIK